MNLKYIAILLFLGVFSSPLYAQIFNPVIWDFESKELGNGTHELIFHASIEPGWHLYSQFIEEGGPIPTSFQFEEGEGYELVGTVSEKGDLTEKFDDLFEMEVKYFSGSASFHQKVKNTGASAINGSLEFMVCDDERCLPPEEVEFSFTLNQTTGQVDKKEAKEETAQINPIAEKSIPNPITPPSAPPINDAPQKDRPGILKPVTWAFSHQKLEDGNYELHLTATLDEGWKIYSPYIESDLPIATTFSFEGGNYEKVGDLEERGKVIKKQDKFFDMELQYFKDKVSFVQVVKFKDSPENIRGELEFICCDEERCLLPELVPFEFDIVGGGTLSNAKEIATLNDFSSEGNPFVIEAVNLDEPVGQCNEATITDGGGNLWTIFLLGFAGGLLALLTPCVFPMIPLTVSFFTKSDGGNKIGLFNAILYGFSIFLIYVLLSLPFHFMEAVDPEILNTISTNVWLNLFFFLVFLVFAISFFGFFEITLPSALANKANAASSIGGILGIFFMALTLALVSFSCTGPILGSLLAGSLSSDGGAMQLSAGMGGFGLALALPFGVFAAFPSWLNSLPRSGGWLTTVKVVLGFIELALAIKFLSNADLVEHWGILKREIFFGAWVVIGIATALYLFGKIKFPHDSPIQKLSKGRLALGIVTLLGVAYLIPGLTNTQYANRKLLSGFPPPLFYSIYEKGSECPLGLECFKDYEEGFEYAKANNKPVILDFTGWACQNCRRMEENVWEKPEIYKRLNEDYVLISLYVDDRKELPQEEQTIITTRAGKQKKIKTIGNKWATLQTETFENNSQPFYVLMSPDEEMLNHPVGYTPNEGDFKNFLDCGLSTFQLNKDQVGNLGLR